MFSVEGFFTVLYIVTFPVRFKGLIGTNVFRWRHCELISFWHDRTFFCKCTLTLALWTLIIIYYIQETYMLQNNFKSSSTTQNWRKLQHSAILSGWRHFCMLCLSKIVILMIPHANFWWFHTHILKYLMIHKF